VPLGLSGRGPDFVIAGPDLLPGLPATPAPLFVSFCAIAIDDDASIAAQTIAIVLRIAFPPCFKCWFQEEPSDGGLLGGQRVICPPTINLWTECWLRQQKGPLSAAEPIGRSQRAGESVTTTVQAST